eukprot:TRINITY_DN4967_c0_g1_i1.p1 TRINITY_DN4967_c0_g1~~TRINITY_DN4967_c0_g1_i1.p1  ORF type:complete len:488 (-),score=86.40 TRINITY_DN4967_c0_g1_i1:71-1534(-)
MQQLLHGQVELVAELLLLHPSRQRAPPGRERATDTFSACAELLNNRPAYDPSATNRKQWVNWRNDARVLSERLQEQAEDAEYAEADAAHFQELLALLCGDHEIIQKHSQAWSDSVSAELLYNHPQARITDIGAIARDIGVDDIDDDLVKMYLAILQLDPENSLRLIEEVTGDNWLLAHISDLMGKLLLFEIQMPDGMALNEVHLQKYCYELLEIPELWQTTISYARWLPKGVHLIDAVLERQPYQTQDKARKLIDIATAHGLDHLVFSIANRLALEEVRFGRHASAISWYLRAQDSDGVASVAAQWLSRCFKARSWSELALAPAACGSVADATLEMLQRVRLFYESLGGKRDRESLRVTADTLLLLLSSPALPLSFWPVVLHDGIGLINNKELVFSASETSSLMHRLEWLILTASRTAADVGTVRAPLHPTRSSVSVSTAATHAAANGTSVVLVPKDVEALRLALTRNLARALMQPGAWADADLPLF